MWSRSWSLSRGRKFDRRHGKYRCRGQFDAKNIGHLGSAHDGSAVRRRGGLAHGFGGGSFADQAGGVHTPEQEKQGKVLVELRTHTVEQRSHTRRNSWAISPRYLSPRPVNPGSRADRKMRLAALLIMGLRVVQPRCRTSRPSSGATPDLSTSFSLN